MSMWDILEFLGRREVEGRLLTANHLAHVVGRGAVDPFFATEHRRRSSRFVRVARGIYYVPHRDDPAMPEPERIAILHAEARGELLQTHGADAAREFGIDAPEATGPRFYTSGPTRDVDLCGVTVRFERVPGVVLLHTGSEAGAALAALHHGRRDPETTVRAMHARLSREARKRVTEVLVGLPQRTVSAWIDAEPAARVALPEAVEPIFPGPSGWHGRRCPRR